MEQKASVKPSKSALLIGIIVTGLFFIFGIVFFIVLSREDAGIGMAFMAFWILFVCIMGGFLIYSYVNYDKKTGMGAEILIRDELNKTRSDTGFDDKLRKLDKLRKEGLISEEEFAAKRNEIMQKKW